MIFISKNNEGIPAWKLILEGKKTVTRRLKPKEVGKDYAVCPGRGKHQICRIKILSCVKNSEWDDCKSIADFDREAKKEGFDSWSDLFGWFMKKKIDIYKTYRIEFEVLK